MIEESKDLIHELEKANVLGKKHEKRLFIAVDIIAAIWKIVTFWRERKENDSEKQD